MVRCNIIAKEIRVLGPLDPGECGDVCPFDALRVTSKGVLVDVSKCLVCLACMALCGPDKIVVVSDWTCSPVEGSRRQRRDDKHTIR